METTGLNGMKQIFKHVYSTNMYHTNLLVLSTLIQRLPSCWGFSYNSCFCFLFPSFSSCHYPWFSTFIFHQPQWAPKCYHHRHPRPSIQQQPERFFGDPPTQQKGDLIGNNPIQWHVIMVYLPTIMVDLYGKWVGKYTIAQWMGHGNWSPNEKRYNFASFF